MITEENDINEFFVYSINGKLLYRQKEESILNSPLIISDLNKNDYITYISNETVVIRSIPTLIRQGCTDIIPNIYCIYPSEDIRTLYGVNKCGTEIYIIKDETKNPK